MSKVIEINTLAKCKVLAYVLIFLMYSCAGKDGHDADYNVKAYEPQYACGFDMLTQKDGESVLLVTKSPWQGADSSSVSKLLILRNGEEAPAGFKGQVLKGDAQRVVCMSSSHIAMLDAIGESERVVGVSGIDFITNLSIQARRDEIVDVGYDDQIDYEKLIATNPDIVLLYGVNGANVIEPKLRELRIPFAYIGEYLEENPLGKSEWMVPVAEIIGKREAAEEKFKEIPIRYENLKAQANEAAAKPRVMINTPYRDSWMMASTGSYLAQLIDDAGGEYAYDKNKSGRSLPIDMEEAYALAQSSDVWINVGQISSLNELRTLFPKFADVKPVKTGEVWNSTLRSTPGRGNDYWESGVVNPDLVLRDLIKIFHPKLMADEPFVYYEQLK